MNGCVALFLCVAGLTAGIASADAKELTITTIMEDPYTMSRGSELEGFCVDLVSRLSKMLDFSYKLQLVKDHRYGTLDPSGRWSGMIGEIIRGEADLAVAPLTLTAVRDQSVDMTTPFMQTGLSFIMREDSASKERTFSLLSPFSTDMWVGVLLAFLLTGLCIFLVGRISPTEWAEPDSQEQNFSLLHSFWYITGALTLQGAGPHPKARSGRVVSAIWWLFSLLLLFCYLSNFQTALHNNSNNNNKHASIQSFEDLANQDVMDYGTVEGGSTMMFFKNSLNPVYTRIYEHMERKRSAVSSTEEGVRRAKEGNFAFIGEAVSLDLAVARNCELTRSQEVVAMRGYAIAAPLGSPLVKNLTNAILRLGESGQLTNLRDKWWASSCAGEDKGHTSEALQPRDLQGLFCLLGLGLGAGLLLALLELLARAHNRAKEGKKSCCSVLRSELNQRFCRGGEEDSDKNKP